MYSIYYWPSTEKYFAEVGESLCYWLNNNNNSCIIQNHIDTNKINIIFGINMANYGSGKNILSEIQLLSPDKIIIFNMEQLHENSIWIKGIYINYLKNFRIWDYNKSNIKYICDNLNNTKVSLFDLGYYPILEKIQKQKKENIDVLFYGGYNLRRARIRDELIKKGINAVFKINTNCWGIERDELISRSKIVLNIHFYDPAFFEIVRVFYLLHNSKFVITEKSLDQDDYKYLDDGMVITKYDNIVDTVIEYLKCPDKRNKISTIGYNNIKKHSIGLNKILNIK